MYFKCIYYSPKINCFLLEICKCKSKKLGANKLYQSKKTHNSHTGKLKSGVLPS